MFFAAAGQADPTRQFAMPNEEWSYSASHSDLIFQACFDAPYIENESIIVFTEGEDSSEYLVDGYSGISSGIAISAGSGTLFVSSSFEVPEFSLTQEQATQNGLAYFSTIVVTGDIVTSTGSVSDVSLLVHRIGWTWTGANGVNMQRIMFGLPISRSQDPLGRPNYGLPNPPDSGMQLCIDDLRDCYANADDRRKILVLACAGAFVTCMTTGTLACAAFSGPMTPICVAGTTAACSAASLLCLLAVRHNERIDIRNCERDLRHCLADLGIWEH
jgi:hypothetical protein